MATNGTDTLAGHWLEDDAFRAPAVERTAPGTRAETSPEPERARVLPKEAQDLALAPLVDKIAYGLARGLVVALKELETHIANETRNVGDAVGRRLDTLQSSFQELTGAVSEQRAVGLAVQEKCEQLATATTALQEADARHAAELTAHKEETGRRFETVQIAVHDLADVVSEHRSASLAIEQKLAATAASLQESDTRQVADLDSLRAEAKDFSARVSERLDIVSKELGIQQDDISGLKSAVSGFSARVDSVMERLDRQAEALRSMYSTYSQRETELEQLVDGLARLRAYPTPPPASRL